ncbi:MAG: hypothetical protein ACE5EL_05400 [Anaerolineae bacterium]
MMGDPRAANAGALDREPLDIRPGLLGGLRRLFHVLPYGETTPFA